MTSKDLLYWSSPPPRTKVVATGIDGFSARGMRRIYGRGDHFGRHLVFHCDIWRTKQGRLLMRCWSRCEGFDWHSFEITRMSVPPLQKPHALLGDESIPKAVRDAYEAWIGQRF